MNREANKVTHSWTPSTAREPHLRDPLRGDPLHDPARTAGAAAGAVDDPARQVVLLVGRPGPAVHPLPKPDVPLPGLDVELAQVEPVPAVAGQVEGRGVASVEDEAARSWSDRPVIGALGRGEQIDSGRKGMTNGLTEEGWWREEWGEREGRARPVSSFCGEGEESRPVAQSFRAW